MSNLVEKVICLPPAPEPVDPATIRVGLVGYADAVGGTTDIVIDTNDEKVDWILVSASAI